MWRILMVVVSSTLLMAIAACKMGADRDTVPIEISAVDLHGAFVADSKAAQQKFHGKHLMITGEVVKVAPRFTGTTMNGQVTSPTRVYFRATTGNPQSDLEYVMCEGDFDVLDSSGMVTVNTRIKVGEQLKVECVSGKLRWSDPTLYLSDCDPVFLGPP